MKRTIPLEGMGHSDVVTRGNGVAEKWKAEYVEKGRWHRLLKRENGNGTKKSTLWPRLHGKVGKKIGFYSGKCKREEMMEIGKAKLMDGNDNFD